MNRPLDPPMTHPAFTPDREAAIVAKAKRIAKLANAMANHGPTVKMRKRAQLMTATRQLQEMLVSSDML